MQIKGVVAIDQTPTKVHNNADADISLISLSELLDNFTGICIAAYSRPIVNKSDQAFSTVGWLDVGSQYDFDDNANGCLMIIVLA